MSFFLMLIAYVLLFLLSEALRPKPVIEDAPAPCHPETIKTGLFSSEIIMVPDGEVWGPNTIRRAPLPSERCAYCETVAVRDARGHCRNCGAPAI